MDIWYLAVGVAVGQTLAQKSREPLGTADWLKNSGRIGIVEIIKRNQSGIVDRRDKARGSAESVVLSYIDRWQISDAIAAAEYGAGRDFVGEAETRLPVIEIPPERKSIARAVPRKQKPAVKRTESGNLQRTQSVHIEAGVLPV